MNTIKRVFINTHMGLNHDGLTALAASYKLSLDSLGDGEHVVFINRARDKVKMYSAGGVIHYLRLRSGEKLDLNTVQHFPKCFTAEGRIDYNKALEKSMGRHLVSRQKDTDGRAVL